MLNTLEFLTIFVHYIVFYCTAFYCWTGRLHCKSFLSDIIIVIMSYSAIHVVTHE